MGDAGQIHASTLTSATPFKNREKTKENSLRMLCLNFVETVKNAEVQSLSIISHYSSAIQCIKLNLFSISFLLCKL